MLMHSSLFYLYTSASAVMHSPAPKTKSVYYYMINPVLCGFLI